MARVLRRPMFRLGGNTDQGIMSGVAPRQGYEHGGIHLNEPLEIEGFQNKKIQNPETKIKFTFFRFKKNWKF